MLKVFENKELEAVFNQYPQPYQQALLRLRALIFDLASATSGVGPLTETLKWGQPSYLTLETNSGTTIRLDRFGDRHIAIFFHCQTTLVDTFRTLFPELSYSKNRAIILDPEEDFPIEALSVCLGMALTYKLNKQRSTHTQPCA